MNTDINYLFVTCAQDLEDLLMDELVELGFKDLEKGFRGVFVRDDSMDAIYRINYCSRIAGRVLLPILKFRCFDQKSLYKCARNIDWRDYIPSGKTFAIDANVKHKQLKNSLYAAQLLKDAVCDEFREKTGNRPSINVENPGVQINLFINNEEGIISIDTSNTPLHKRNYRIDSVEAPMQESLAAAILRRAGYTKDNVLFDPCCGSGTILIEAAMIASKTAPGFLRQKWGFMLLPEFSNDDWIKVRAEIDSQRCPIPENHLFGLDINKQAFRVANGNLKAAGFLKDVLVKNADFREYEPGILPDMVVTNPPHGIRLDNVDVLVPLYRSLGDFMKRKTKKPAKGFIFTANTPLVKETGLSATKKHVIKSSGIDSRLLEFDIY